jgi:hypothetical protein
MVMAVRITRSRVILRAPVADAEEAVTADTCRVTHTLPTLRMGELMVRLLNPGCHILCFHQMTKDISGSGKGRAGTTPGPGNRPNLRNPLGSALIRIRKKTRKKKSDPTGFSLCLMQREFFLEKTRSLKTNRDGHTTDRRREWKS